MAGREHMNPGSKYSSSRYRDGREHSLHKTHQDIVTTDRNDRDLTRNSVPGRNSRASMIADARDSKISTQTRILARADTEEMYACACHQVVGLLDAPENRKYVTKNFSYLHQNLLDGYKCLIGTTWKDTGIMASAKLLGALMNSMESNSSAVCNWLTDSIFAACEDSKSSVVTVIRDVMLAALPYLKPPQISILMKCVHDQLEEVSDPSVFKVFSTIFAMGLLNGQGNTEAESFSDFVDVIIGWMTDGYENELGDTYFHLYSLIQDLSPIFARQLGFLGDLVGSIVEFVKEAAEEKPPSSVKIVRLLKTLECLLALKPRLSKKFLNTTVEQLVETINTILSQEASAGRDRFFRDCIHFTNENLSRVPGVDGKAVQTFIQAEIEWFESEILKVDTPTFTNELLAGFLSVLNCWIDTVVTQIHLSEGIESLCRRILLFLDYIQPHFSSGDKASLVRVTQAFLRTRNVPLLQTVYQWNIDKLQRESQNNGNRLIRTDIDTQLFVIAAIAEISTIKSSILALWALNPSIMEVLVRISNETSYEPVRFCALEMLKSHCIAHSHFASNVTSSKIFDTGTPALQFLTSLLEFWKNSLKDRTFPRAAWLFDWISSFFNSTAPYAPALIERHGDIYCQILRLTSNWPELLDAFGILLEWMLHDTNYSQCDTLHDAEREICLKILLRTTNSASIRTKYQNILKLLPGLIFLPDELLPKLQEPSFIEIEAQAKNYEEGMGQLEFNVFLQHLLVLQPGQDEAPTKHTVNAAVDYVIESKLKTVLGRAPEFFSQLAQMVRKILAKGICSNHGWKLDFLYLLHRKIYFCIHESAFITCDVPESTRSFYLTNKIPCTGWIKRMAPECIELSLGFKRYDLAYFFAVLVEDISKIKLALLELQDSAGLKGLNYLAGFYYLNSEYEKAEELANATVAVESDPVANLLLDKTKLIFDGSSSKLQTWPEPDPVPQIQDLTQISLPVKLPPEIRRPPWNPMLLKLPVESHRSLLSLQLALLGDRADTEVLSSLESFSKLNLFEMIQLEDFILTSKKYSIDEKRRIQNAKLNKMIECGNVKWLRHWITTSGWLGADKAEVSLEQKVNTYRILGDLLYREGDLYEAGTLYSCVLELMFEKDGGDVRGQLSPIIPNQFRADFYLAFAQKVKNSDVFYERTISKSRLLSIVEGKHQAQQEFFDRARECARTCNSQIRADVWYYFAAFAYDRSEAEDLSSVFKEVMKSNALHAYSNFMKWNQKKPKQEKERGKIMLAMIRLVMLFHQNHKFIPEDLLTSSLWLMMLPELVKIPELRAYLVNKFPSESNFLVASKEFVHGKKQFARRGRTLFDPVTYSYTEVSEEPFETGKDQPNLSNVKAQIHGHSVEAVLKDHWGSESRPKLLCQPAERSILLQQLMKPYITIVGEIERIGTTKQELWAETIVRLTNDWAKRTSALRKDLARDRCDQSEKIKVCFRPVLTFLKAMWQQTMESDTLADVAFIWKYGNKMEAVVKEFENCSSLDHLNQIYDILLQYAVEFESAKTSKLMLDNVSPILAHWTFEHTSITLPGMGDGITVTSVQSTITCLHTITHPKRIGFRGSNGRMYEYLIKGNENLQIDAGIMQMLRVTEECSGCPTRHYSVVPIAERGGLIQIVPNAVSLFLLYKKFLQRHNTTERPSEMFWRRLDSLGYNDRDNLEGLKEVYKSLKEETPSDLISKELLMHAETTMDWYNAVKTYTRDSAMGAAIGYSVELADRHLDNILMNLREGNLIHVDFSILFGKGATLKVPECVPFRLTQNVVQALQYPGIYGAFAAYLDEFLGKFKHAKDCMSFCIENIAQDAQLNEGLSVSPELILRSEIASTLDLIRFRVKNVWKMMEIVMAEILECTNQVKDTSSVWNLASPRITLERLGKRLYRWRRLLANLDPLITFVMINTKGTQSLEGFHDEVLTNWIPRVMDFWSNTDIEVVTQSQAVFEEKFQICEQVMQNLQCEISKFDSSNFETSSGPIVNSGEQRIDKGKLQAMLASAKARLSAYSPSKTANTLIAEATNVDNLAQMYEGWIPWA